MSEEQGFSLISLSDKLEVRGACSCACIRASVGHHKDHSLTGSSPSALCANRLIDFRGILSPLIGSKTTTLSLSLPDDG